MTEEEAKAKVCAFTRERRQSGAADMCLGRACMAWVWLSDFNDLNAKWPDIQDLRTIADGGCVRLGAKSC